MDTAIGKRQHPLSTREIKEVRTKDGSSLISVIEYKYQSIDTVVTVYLVVNKVNNRLKDCLLLQDRHESFDMYYDLVDQAYRNGLKMAKNKRQAVL